MIDEFVRAVVSRPGVSIVAVEGRRIWRMFRLIHKALVQPGTAQSVIDIIESTSF